MAQSADARRKLRKENLIQRKQKIKSAAQELFSKNGYRFTTIEAVARTAGYSKRTVYLDFMNKDDLFISLAADGLEFLLNDLKKIPMGMLPLETYIERYVETIVDFSYHHQIYFHMFAVDATRDIIENCSDETKRRAAEIEIAGFGLIAAEVERAIQEKVIPPTDAWEAAGIFIGAVVGIILLSLGGSQVVFKQKDLVAKAKTAGRLIVKGLFSKRPA